MDFRTATLGARPARAPEAGDAVAARLPLRRRLLFGALLAGLALVGVAGGLAWHQYDDARQSAVNDARARVILAGTIIDTYFSGELATLGSIAESPSMLAGDTVAMRAYFKRLQVRQGGRFTGGLGWIDRAGVPRVSSNPVPSSGLNVSDRSYFKTVMATGAPFVSEGIAARRTRRQIIVLAVPTRDAGGRLTGVLAGSLLVRAFQAPSGSIDLGFTGLAVLDRHGRAVLAGFTRPRNRELQQHLARNQVGLLASTHGLDGSPDHLVAYATAQVPGWTIVIDRPRSSVFAAARRGLLLELALIAAAAATVLSLIGRALVRARRESERQSARARQRAELSHALGTACRAAEVSSGLARGLAAAFPGALSIVALEAEDRLGLELSAAAEGEWPLSALATDLLAAQPATRAYESGLTVALESEARLREQFPELHHALGGRARSLYAAPLRARGGRAIGALCLVFGDERAIDDADQAHVAWYAEEAAHALGRARSYEHEHAVAVTLQRSLLAQELPEVEGVELLGRYQAGAAGLEVGGDWYDVIRRSDGVVLITVGDVAGRGVKAAVLMGQMRNAFRAYAYDHPSPADVLRRMRRHITEEEMATAVCLALDPYTQELTYASAGHPPSLLAGRSGGVSRLDGAGAPPLGFARDEDIREVALPLTPHATVVVYTDGLVERRDWSLDVGIDLLAGVLESSSTLSAETLATRIIHDVAGPVGSGDDIALLIVRLAGVPDCVSIEIPSDPAELAGLRKRLRTWMDLRGVGEQERDDAVLAVSEACNNAIEHAYRGGSGAIRLRLEHRVGTLEIAVEDRGSWRPPVPSPERGRGLEIMRAVMHETGIEREPGGTRVLLTRRLAR